MKDHFSDRKVGFCHLVVKICLPLALIVLVTSCRPPIWSEMKKRAEADLAARTLNANQKVLASDNFRNVFQNWVPEAEGNYIMHYSEADTCLDIEASKGLTLWYKTPFQDDFRIQYEICAVDQNDSLDRISDLNCFWLASDPVYPDSIFKRMNFREGAMGRYYSLQLYSMSFGGNSNTSTQFRRHNGDYDAFRHDMKRPEILMEYHDQPHLIIPNHWYTIEIKVQQGIVQYMLDGEVLVNYTDPSPLKKGWFGIRTSENHMRVRNFVTFKL